jgi:hypothetical protein
MTKQERKRARHARRVASRAIAKKGREIGDILVTNLFARKSLVPYVAPPIAPPRFRKHPTWDQLLNFGGNRIRSWVSGLLLRPSEPQQPLLLTGPQRSGKTMFHDAMLLPKDSILWPWDLRDLKSWLVLRGIWMMVVEGCPPYYAHILGNSRQEPNRDGRYLKWCLTTGRGLRNRQSYTQDRQPS